jgi:arsenate reductase
VKATIWHNPRCSKSREVLEILQKAPDVEVEVVEYLKKPPTRTELVLAYRGAGLQPRQGLRMAEAAAAPLANHNNGAILDAMVANPRLIERPVVITEKGARLCRPSEKVYEIL